MTAFIGERRRNNVKLFLTVRSKLIKLTLLLLVLWFAPCIQAQVAGKVQGLRGEWFVGENKLSLGVEINTGSLIRRESSSKQDYIVITDLGGNRFVSRQCNVAETCSQFKLPPAPRATIYNYIFDAVTKLLRGEPSRYSVHLSRGDEDVLSDAVVFTDGSTIDFSRVFKKAKTGLYNFQYRSITRGKKSATGKWSEPIAFDWTPTKPAKISIPNLQPGLYELNLLEKMGEDFKTTGTSAWILASETVAYKKNAASFEEAIALTTKWSGDVDSNQVRSFLHAYLDYLSAQKTGKQKTIRRQSKN